MPSQSWWSGWLCKNWTDLSRWITLKEKLGRANLSGFEMRTYLTSWTIRCYITFLDQSRKLRCYEKELCNEITLFWTSWGWAVPSSGQATFFWPWLRSLFTLIWNGLHIFGLPTYWRLSSYLSSPSYSRFSSYLNVLDILSCFFLQSCHWYHPHTVETRLKQ